MTGIKVYIDGILATAGRAEYILPKAPVVTALPLHPSAPLIVMVMEGHLYSIGGKEVATRFFLLR